MPKTVKKAATKKTKDEIKEEKTKGSNFFDYLRFGESYTSLILGIIVVIIATALLLSFVHNKNAGNINTPINQQTQNNVQVSQQANTLAQKAPNTASDSIPTPEPTDTVAPTVVPTAMSTVTPKPTVKPKLIVHPTIKPTEVVKKLAKANPSPTMKPKPVVKKIVMAKPTPTPQINNSKTKNVWIVQKNESLWLIAEKKYTSGYNWVDIAKANNLADPSDIHVGDRLILPSVTPGPSTIAAASATVTTNDEQFSSTKQAQANTITGTTYTVVHGDNLWTIAVRAYGDGYKWTDIAKANNLATPGMIFSGNVITIPRS